jgi:2-polyprenyl-3-methyl-5-hydroxy-6-metoxy-1,4-benzoquinol methylase
MSFNHNDHYHRFLLRQVPAPCRRALDVGCGSGGFARLLAGRAEAVEAFDRSPEMIAAARARPPTRVTYRAADVHEVELPAGGYDFISCIAAIHHMPFAPTIERLRAALAPGGGPTSPSPRSASCRTRRTSWPAGRAGSRQSPCRRSWIRT